MEITLIYPKWERTINLFPDKYQQTISKFHNAATPGLPILASLTPPDIELYAINEFYETIDPDRPTDAVAISFFTPQATRAYELSALYRERGIITIAGGIHPSVLPEEAGEHFDKVVIGEVENIWEEVIADLRTGNKRRFYQGTPLQSFDNVPLPAREIFNKYGQQLIQPVQTSRGCYVSLCETCVIPGVYGKSIRMKSMDRLREEIAAIKEKVLYLVDDHVIWGNSSHAREIFSAIKDLDKYILISGAPSNLTGNPAFLKLAKDSGCHMAYVCIGFDPETSNGLFKNYDKLVKQLLTIKDAGVLPIVSYFLGMDTDDKSIFDQVQRFNEAAQIEAVDYAIYCPFPGTPAFARYARQKRLLHSDWSKYNYMHPVYQPMRMSTEELIKGFNMLWQKHFEKYSSIEDNTEFFKNIIKLIEPHISVPPIQASRAE